MKHRATVIAAVLLAGCLVGCGNGVQTAQTVPAAMEGADAAGLMAAAQDALGQMHFMMDKYDLDAGYIRTRPQRASQFFEPWRQDNASAVAFAQANTDSLRRTVEVFVEPHGQNARLRCVVNVEKLSLPPEPIRGMAYVAGMHTESNRRFQTLTLDSRQVRRMEWVDMGRDHDLEQRILDAIARQQRKG